MTKLSLITKHGPVTLKAHVSPAFSPALGEADFRVMCATDLWGPSDHALQKALWLAESTDAELLLLHVVDGETPLRLTGKRADHARRALEWRVRQWPHFKPRPGISVRVGNPRQTISRVAREWRADLVVLGASRPRVMDRFVATTAERVAAEAHCAVLVVNRGSPEPYPDATIVAPSCCQAVALEHAAARFQILKSGARPQTLRSDARPGKMAEALLRRSPDLVVVEADRWPALTCLLRRSAASMLARSTTTDVLITPRSKLAEFSVGCPRHLRVAA